MTNRDPRQIMEYGSMSRAQWVAVLITVGLNALDGFDVLSISFASPGIASDWQLDSATLGWVLAMELLGMAVGSLALGPVADKVGRRATILGCLVAMTAGMFGAGFATGIAVLLAWRLITGLGIGGMLAAINAAAAEFSNLRWRGLAMALMVIGYPIGGVLGGLIVQQILADGSWHDVFFFGAVVTAAFIPVVWFLVPETPAFLDRQRAPGALERINGVLGRLGHQSAEALTTWTEATQKASVVDIFRPALLMTTVLVTLAYFAHITSFYFLLKWIPKIVVDMGFEPRAAAGFLTWMNVGGATGGAIFGLISVRVGLRPLTIVTLIGASLMIFLFGRGPTESVALTATVVAAGFFTNAAIVGLYAMFAKVFPTHVRATGTGFAIGLGRGGAALAPVLAGYLFQFGFSLQTVALIMGSGALLAAIALFALGKTETD
jgi:benzoate transport